MRAPTAALNTSWPPDGLETVPVCPICGDGRRELLYSGLTDMVFFCAPGEWTLSRCIACCSGYLNPRPNAKTIGLAYTNYPTHEPPQPSLDGAPSWLARLKAGLRNDYFRSRYGAALRTSVPLGRLVVYLAIRRRLSIDRSVRHIRPPAPGARLLDVGCGNGQFLLAAKALGWEAWGIDADSDAVKAARVTGLRVEHDTFPNTGMAAASFDAVTMNHVIEHLHDPVGALREVRRLLKPGGILWIATPNLESLGSRYYRWNWRGLEAPRHLVLFTVGSLRHACITAGFPAPGFRRSLQAGNIFWASEQIAQGPGRCRSGLIAMQRRWRWMARGADFATFIWPKLGEEIVALVRR
jgi:2-polyprenyl-3-methyl-5-hydroxy-6-metoxy-1,4-benzoquinol methylase